jgi:hypothetical protein
VTEAPVTTETHIITEETPITPTSITTETIPTGKFRIHVAPSLNIDQLLLRLDHSNSTTVSNWRQVGKYEGEFGPEQEVNLEYNDQSLWGHYRLYVAGQWGDVSVYQISQHDSSVELYLVTINAGGDTTGEATIEFRLDQTFL